MTRRLALTAGAVTLIGHLAAAPLAAQQPAPAGPQPFTVGNRLGMPINPAPDGKFDPM
jgi:hypothetical protein